MYNHHVNLVLGAFPYLIGVSDSVNRRDDRGRLGAFVRLPRGKMTAWNFSGGKLTLARRERDRNPTPLNLPPK